MFKILVCLMLLGVNVFAADDFNAIDRYIAGKMQGSRIPGVALVIVKGDQIVYLKGYGQADSSGRPAGVSANNSSTTHLSNE